MVGIGTSAWQWGTALTLLLCAVSPQARADPDPSPTYDIALSLAIDVGTAAMTSFGSGVDSFVVDLRTLNPEISLESPHEAGPLLGLSPRVRIGLPHSTFVEAGLGYLRQSGEFDINIGTLPAKFSYRNSSIEIPVVFGGYLYSAGSTKYYGALGPSILVRNRSSWSYNQGEVSSFSAGRGGGLEFQLGANVFMSKRFALQILMRYRVSRSTEMEVLGERLPPVQELGEVDYSGISFGVGGQWHTL